MAQSKKVEDEPQDVSAYIGTDPIYQNYADDRNKPFKAEPDTDEDGNDNDEALAAEERAYEIQGQQREAVGQDPETGEQVLTEDEILERNAQLNAGPNIPSRATGVEGIEPHLSQPVEEPVDSTPPPAPSTPNAE